MKILHIGKYYTPIEGGIESINHVVVEALQGQQQRIITFNVKNQSIEEDIEGIPVIRASSSGIVASQPLSWKYFKEIRRAIKLFNPDIIHFHYPNPLGVLYILIVIQRQNKLIVHWHSDVVAQKIMKPLLKPIEKLLLTRADSVIATSPTYIDASPQLNQVRDKISIIPCSINEDKFAKKDYDNKEIQEIKKRYGNKPIIFFVGRHVQYKGIQFLLEAEKIVKSDCVFVIAGNGPLTENLKKKYSSNRVYWLGRIDDDKMRQIMYASSIFAFPSVTRNEAFGVALAEAMYCYCPSVSFAIDGSGVNWVSPNQECGIVVPNSNITELANAIDDLIKNNEKREALSINAHNRVEELFTKACVKSQYQSLYNKLYKGE